MRMKIGLVALALCAAALGAFMGSTPLNDLGAGTYQGYQGGLYPGGSNQPPPAQASAAFTAAGQVKPMDGNGNPTSSGKIVMLSIGMSNTTHEFSVFERQEDTNANRNAALVIINAALGGQDSATIRNPDAPYWRVVDRRIAGMGATAQQVQVVWLKEAKIQPPNDFPGHALQLEDDLKAIVRLLKDRFPNLRLCYVSSRIYGGYATGNLNPEPQAYESGFSVKWLIEDQIDGDPALNYDPGKGTVEAPVLLWGPYMWADGTNPRSDGLIWVRDDFEGDGTHPAPSGEQKVGDMLTSFFNSDVSTKPWYKRWPGYKIMAFDTIADAHISSAQPNTNFGAANQLLTQSGGTTQTVYLKFDLRSAPGLVVGAKLNLRTINGSPDTTISVVPDSSWAESTITYSNAPPLGSALRMVPNASKDGTISCDVTAAVNNDPDHVVTFALTPAAGQGNYHSKEANQPPRLTLTVKAPQ